MLEDPFAEAEDVPAEPEKKWKHFGKLTSPMVRLLANTNKNGPIHPVCGQCWIWLGKPDVYGYGRLTINYVRLEVHRWSYILNVGDIPDGKCVLHRCDNPMCIRPEHLFLGTRTDNMLDKVAKGRQLQGEDCPGAKLTDEDVREIRRRYVQVNKVVSNAVALAAEFGVSRETIVHVAKKKRWKHIADIPNNEEAK